MIENKKILITSRGGNKQVINTILEVLAENINSCCNLVQNLTGLNTYDKCYSVFEYVVNNVAYVEDSGNNQYIKTPARTLHDGYADCKSMAILVACCLQSLNVDYVIRFVDFTGNKIYTHVYVVAYDNGREIVIDPVERVNGQPIFDYATKYVNKIDYRYE